LAVRCDASAAGFGPDAATTITGAPSATDLHSATPTSNTASKESKCCDRGDDVLITTVGASWRETGLEPIRRVRLLQVRMSEYDNSFVYVSLEALQSMRAWMAAAIRSRSS